MFVIYVTVSAIFLSSWRLWAMFTDTVFFGTFSICIFHLFYLSKDFYESFGISKHFKPQTWNGALHTFQCLCIFHVTNAPKAWLSI